MTAFCAAALTTCFAGLSAQIDQAINHPHVPVGVLIDFTGPPTDRPYVMSKLRITFAGTPHTYDDDSVGNRYDPNMRQVSLWSMFDRLGNYRFKVIGKTRLLLEGCVIDGKFHPATDVQFRFERLPANQYPRVFKAKKVA